MQWNCGLSPRMRWKDPLPSYSLAVVYARTNEPDLAFGELAILAKTPGGLDNRYSARPTQVGIPFGKIRASISWQLNCRCMNNFLNREIVFLLWIPMSDRQTDDRVGGSGKPDRGRSAWKAAPIDHS